MDDIIGMCKAQSTLQDLWYADPIASESHTPRLDRPLSLCPLPGSFRLPQHGNERLVAALHCCSISWMQNPQGVSGVHEAVDEPHL